MNKKFDELLLKTAFCCMASDGEIAQEEIDTIQKLCQREEMLKKMDFQNEIKRFVEEINKQGMQFIKNYLDELEKTSLTEQENINLLNIVFEVIFADGKVEYSEVKFFRNIRIRLSISDEVIEKNFANTPDLDIFLAKDIVDHLSVEKVTQQYFSSIEIPQFNLEEFKM
ncbi:TerB family tellurite resistance protein [Capnocytophaga granulosa]|uniref:tellurite resistance TerB family protein n=1 Tax=Capnocytophaga granulosa TaxID=45242 RepID=UPI0023F0B56B|nr:TerB family tellurite resistance protein [Capnocytophaga granulosa]